MSAVGFVLGAWTGALFFVTKADGIVGGVMVLWYGLLGAIILLVISIVLGLKLKGKTLFVTALVFALLAAGIFGAAAYMSWKRLQADLGQASEYDAILDFTASMDRLDMSDPYLFVKMEIDSRKRKWIQTGPAPKNDVFEASIRAKKLAEIREGLEDLARLSQDEFDACRNTPGPFTKQLSWHLEMERNVQFHEPMVAVSKINLSETCLHEHPVIQRALWLVESVSRSPAADLKRK